MFKKLLLGATAATFSALPIYAQETSPGTVQTGDKTRTLDTVTVRGTRGALNDALELKRDATTFIDAIVAEDIAQFPDLNIAEALQRVPGVTISRSQGEGSQIFLRGFTPEFTRVEINGMSATPTSLGREFNFSIFASELFTRAEVRKTTTADQTEGGLAGTVSLFTPKPLDFDNNIVFAANVQASYAELSESTDPRVSLVIGKNWNDRFGLAATLAFSDQSFVSQWADTSNWDRASDSITNSAEVGVDQRILDAWIPRAPRALHFDRQRERVGATFDLQYQLTDSALLTWSTLYGQTDLAGDELRTDYAELEGGLGTPSDVVIDNIIDGRGRIVSGTFPEAQPRVYTTDRSDDEEFFQSVLHADVQISELWRAKAQIGITQGEGVFFDRTYSFGVFGDGTVDVEGDFVTVSVPGVDFTDPADFPNFRFADNRTRTKQDDEFASQFDLIRSLNFGPFTSLSFGGRYADHTAEVTEMKWGGINDSNPVYPDSARNEAGRAVGLNGVPASMITLVPLTISGAPAAFPSHIIRIDLDAADRFYGLTGLEREFRPLASFEVNEEIFAAYARTDFESMMGHVPVAGNLGLRWVETSITSSGARSLSGEVTPIVLERSYDELLPSASLRASLRKDLVLRLAAGRTLNRPNLADLSPRQTLDLGRQTGSSGNPELDPYTATYFDVGLEWYFAEEGLIAASYFRKDIDSLVETLAEDVTLVVPGTLGEPPSPKEFQLTRPINGNEAEVQGIEFIAQTPFTFLPAPFDRFGGLFNYTYAQSEANFEDEGNVSSIQLPGLSENSFNAVLYHQTERSDIRLAYAWRSEFVERPFGPGGNPIWQDAFGQLDLSASFQLTEQIALQLEGLNLTEEGEFLYTDGRTDLPVRRADNERRFVIGLRYAY